MTKECPSTKINTIPEDIPGNKSVEYMQSLFSDETMKSFNKNTETDYITTHVSQLLNLGEITYMKIIDWYGLNRFWHIEYGIAHENCIVPQVVSLGYNGNKIIRATLLQDAFNARYEAKQRLAKL